MGPKAANENRIDIFDPHSFRRFEQLVEKRVRKSRSRRRERGGSFYRVRVKIFGWTCEARVPAVPLFFGAMILTWVAVFWLAFALQDDVVRTAVPPGRDSTAPQRPSAGAGEGETVPADSTSRPRVEPPDALVANGPERSGFLMDVREAFDEGESSGLVDFDTAEEWERFEEWRARIWRPGDATLPIPNLYFVDREPDGVRLYRISFPRTLPLGVIRLRKVADRWHIVGLASGDRFSRANRNRSAERGQLWWSFRGGHSPDH